jgi:hypothetical protein
MRKYSLHFVLILLMTAISPAFAGSFGFNKSLPEEKVALFTDRSIYISGEQIHFFAAIFFIEGSDPENQSKVIYCELITPDGNKIAENKSLVSESSAEGCIEIPTEQISGVYYLRAYTKVMRNYGPETYSYSQIRIVNPDRKEVLTAENQENLSGIPYQQKADTSVSSLFTISLSKSVYESRDSIIFSVKSLKMPVSGIKNLCLSVVPESTGSTSFVMPPYKDIPTPGTNYFTENRGVSLTGKLTENTSSNPVQGKRVNLSIIGDGRDFMAVRSDSLGRFFFALPELYGAKDLFLSSEKTTSSNTKIWVDNDFCTLPVHLPFPAFQLSAEERKDALNMALNVKISSHFHPDTIEQPEKATNIARAFYGEPAQILKLDQYIQLPTLEEYFNEIPGMVRVRKRNGEKYFKITGDNDLSFYDPLVLVDWIAVDEPARILAVSPQNISCIEIVNRLYVKGGETYGGIISIISKKGDFAGIDLPSTGIFLNYLFLSGNECKVYKDYSLPGHPDTRNTLFWKPAASFNDVNNSKFAITAPDTPGKYSVILRGITNNGVEFRKSINFDVKN